MTRLKSLKKKDKMNKNIYAKIMLGILSLVTVFHLCIIARLIPYDIAWGGRLKNDTEMYAFETLSLIINLFLGLILLMKGGYLKFQFSEKVINITLWAFLVIFILNTAGNILAKTSFEKSFAFLTLLLAWLIWKILRYNPVHAASTPPDAG